MTQERRCHQKTLAPKHHSPEKISGIKSVNASVHMLNSYLNEKVRKIVAETSNSCGHTDVVNVILSVKSLKKLSNISRCQQKLELSYERNAQYWKTEGTKYKRGNRNLKSKFTYTRSSNSSGTHQERNETAGAQFHVFCTFLLAESLILWLSASAACPGPKGGLIPEQTSIKHNWSYFNKSL